VEGRVTEPFADLWMAVGVSGTIDARLLELEDPALRFEFEDPGREDGDGCAVDINYDN